MYIKNGLTALICGCGGGHLNVIKNLLIRGACLELKSKVSKYGFIIYSN